MKFKTLIEHNSKCSFAMPVGFSEPCPECKWNPCEAEDYDYTEGGMW